MNASTPSSSGSAAWPPPRVVPNAARAFGGVWRLLLRQHFKPMHWLLLGGMLALLVLFSYAAAPTRDGVAHRFLPWAMGFYACLVVPVLSFILAAGLARDDVQADTVDYILTRPVPRPLYVFFRYIAHVACVQLDFLIALAVIVATGFFRNVPALGEAVPTMLLTQGLAVLAFSAFGFLCGTLTSRYIIVGLLYGAVIEIGMGSVPTQLQRLSMLRHMSRLASPIIGAKGDGPQLVAPLSMAATAALLFAFSIAMVAVAAVLFSRKEFSGTSGRET